jgi:ABC-2 type transport system permease protein
MLVALLLGALLVTGVGFLLASVSKDMIAVVGWGILALVVLSLPAFGVMFPGTIADWVKAIPSYYLVDAVHRATSFNAGWGEVWLSLLVLLASATAILTLGTVVLRRKLR